MSVETSQGSCLCGAVTFTVTGKPGKVLACYCNDCEKNAGGPYQVIAGFQASHIQVQDIKGHIKIFTITEGTQSGHPKEKHFCSNCGCTLWTVPMKHKGQTLMVRTSLMEDGLRKFPVESEIFKKVKP